MQPHASYPTLSRRIEGFTLVELFVVIAILSALMALLLPAFTSHNGSADLAKAAYDIAGTLDQARAYAMANNTYVFVGLAEVDASVDFSATPQVSSGDTPYGRVAVAVVTSKDGTRGYDVSTPSTWVANYNTAIVKNLVPVGKLQRFENLHLVDFGGTPSSGNMARPNYPANGRFKYTLGAASCVTATPFDWPLGAVLGAGQYSFTKVIQFDPQGVSRMQTATNTDVIVQNIEIGLQPTHGNAIPALPTSQNAGNQAAIQINGMTGATHIYRP